MIGDEGGLRSRDENEATRLYAEVFERSDDPLPARLSDVAKYARRQDLTSLLARYEIFKEVLGVKGSVVECGVYRGSGLMAWAKFSAILEPNNIMRRIYGFDTFRGFDSVSGRDRTEPRQTRAGELAADSQADLERLIEAFDKNRFLGHVPKVHLVVGDATVTIPRFIEGNPHVLVSLLFLDFDLYEPTLVALQHFLPRMPRGAVIAFHELDHPAWPGETLAALQALGERKLELRRLTFDPYTAYACIQ